MNYLGDLISYDMEETVITDNSPLSVILNIEQINLINITTTNTTTNTTTTDRQTDTCCLFFILNMNTQRHLL